MKRVFIKLFMLTAPLMLMMVACSSSPKIHTMNVDQNPSQYDRRLALIRIDVSYLHHGFVTSNRMIIGPVAQSNDLIGIQKALQIGFEKALKRHQMNSLVEVTSDSSRFLNQVPWDTNTLTLKAEKHLAGWNGQVNWQILMGLKPLWMARMDAFQLGGSCQKDYVICADNFAESLIVYMKANHLISPKSMAEIPSPGDQ